MYEAYWELEAKPFEATDDARFYYPGEGQQGALLKLRYAVENRRAAALLSGDAGLGKTLLVQTLASQLDSTFSPLVRVVFPQMPPQPLLSYLCHTLTGEGTLATQPIDQSVWQIEAFLRTNAQEGRHAILVLDEAHMLAQFGALDTIRLLTNFEWEGRPTSTILLVGQAGLIGTVDRKPELDERLAVKCLLRRLSCEETAAYIEHRLQAAAAKRPIFSSDAIEIIYALSQGVPRRINRVCDLALLVGYAEERAKITAEQVEAVGEDLVTTAAVQPAA